jgi:hypothetical protein
MPAGWPSLRDMFDVTTTILIVLMTWVIVSRTSTAHDIQASGMQLAGG